MDTKLTGEGVGCWLIEEQPELQHGWSREGWGQRRENKTKHNNNNNKTK